MTKYKKAVKKYNTGELSSERLTAIEILESIANALGNEYIFDNKTGDKDKEPDGTWYEFEDMITNLIATS